MHCACAGVWGLAPRVAQYRAVESVVRGSTWWAGFACTHARCAVSHAGHVREWARCFCFACTKLACAPHKRPPSPLTQGHDGPIRSRPRRLHRLGRRARRTAQAYRNRWRAMTPLAPRSAHCLAAHIASQRTHSSCTSLHRCALPSPIPQQARSVGRECADEGSGKDGAAIPALFRQRALVL